MTNIIHQFEVKGRRIRNEVEVNPNITSLLSRNEVKKIMDKWSKSDSNTCVITFHDDDARLIMENHHDELEKFLFDMGYYNVICIDHSGSLKPNHKIELTFTKRDMI